jgi:hypothetical protein
LLGTVLRAWDQRLLQNQFSLVVGCLHRRIHLIPQIHVLKDPEEVLHKLIAPDSFFNPLFLLA